MYLVAQPSFIPKTQEPKTISSCFNSKNMKINKISTTLWFDNEAEEAALFYTSIFKNSSIGKISRFGKEGFEFHGKPEGSVMTVEFQIEGMSFVALNGGPIFKFTEAISFVVNCKTQEEVDYYWEKLGEDADPKYQQCGWLKDKYGISWQIVPEALGRLMSDPDAKKAKRASQAMFTMKKFDIKALEDAFNGEI